MSVPAGPAVWRPADPGPVPSVRNKQPAVCSIRPMRRCSPSVPPLRLQGLQGPELLLRREQRLLLLQLIEMRDEIHQQNRAVTSGRQTLGFLTADAEILESRVADG